MDWLSTRRMAKGDFVHIDLVSASPCFHCLLPEPVFRRGAKSASRVAVHEPHGLAARTSCARLGHGRCWLRR